MPSRSPPSIRALDARARHDRRVPSTWADLGAACGRALETFHLHGTWWSVRPDDAATVDAVRALLLEGFPAIDALGAHAPRPSAADAAEMIDRTLAARRGRHGASSVGIHVGAVSSSRGLVFDHVVIVGASEGLLPPVRGEDPLLPGRRTDAACAEYPTTCRGERARGTHGAGCPCGGARRGLVRRAAVARRTARTGGRAAQPVPAAGRSGPGGIDARQPRPRSGSPRVGPPRRARGDCRARHPTRRCCRALPASPRGPRPSPGRTSASWASPSGAWSLHDRDLSASGIEQFLHCPYHFFVQRILGFSTDEFEDSVDTIAPSDMGTLLHSAFERFVEKSRTDGTLPAGRAGVARLGPR